MLMDQKLAAVVEKYRSHPEFLGIEVVDPNQPGAVDNALLHIAARTGAVDDIRTLVSCGARINTPGDLGNTPLHQAALKGRSDSITELLKLGADTNVRNEFGQTPLEVAELGGHSDAARVLGTKTGR
jgi:ankyrin repeat protein